MSKETKQKKRGVLFYLLYNIAVCFVLFEVLIFAIFSRPQILYSLPSSFAAYINSFYHAVEMNSIQFISACSRYDSDLFYLLKNDSCTFTNAEFKTTVRGNSAGLRDDESALEAPEVLFLGDSFTMGWGVEEAESYPTLFEKLTDLKTLNAGMSSYGTARELILAKRLDLTALRYVFIQYSHNDISENQVYSSAAHFKNKTKEEYDFYTDKFELSRRWFPGRYVGSAIAMLARELRSQSASPTPPTPREHLKSFLATYEKFAPEIFRQTPVFVYFPEKDSRNRELIDLLIATISDNPELENITVVELKGSLNQKHYFIIDEHLNAVGHEVVAKKLQAALEL